MLIFPLINFCLCVNSNYMELYNATDHKCLSIDWSTFGREILNIDNNVSLLTVNLRSINYKFSELVGRLAMLAFKFTFIIVTETWLNKDNDVYKLPGYKSCSVVRSEVRGGGVKIYYRDSMDVCVIDNLSGVFQSYEGVFLNVNIRHLGNLVVGGVYRPPSSPLDAFMNVLEEFLSHNNLKCILIGDFNINLLANTASNFINLMHEYSFKCTVNVATYFSPLAVNDTSCLDHVWHNLTYMSQTFVISSPIADHHAVASFFIIIFLNSYIRLVFVISAIKNIINFLNNFGLEFPDAFSHDINAFGRELVVWLMNVTNKYFPIKTKTLTAKRIDSLY